MSRPKVLLTNPIDPCGTQIIESAADIVLAPDAKHETLYRLVADADVLVVRAFFPPICWSIPIVCEASCAMASGST